MATEWISPTWRMPNDKNQSKFENYSLTGTGTVDISQPAVVGITSSYSWWMSRNTATGNASNFYNVVGTSAYGMFFLNSSLIYLRYGGNYVILSSTELTNAILEVDVWQNWTITREEVSATAQDIKLYIDGVLVVEVLNTTGLGILGSSVKQVFGGGSIVKMLDFNVFDYVLSESQRNYLYNSGTPQNPMAISGQPPIAYYPLGGSSTGSSSTLTIPNESVPSATVFESDPGFFDLPGSSLAPILSGISNFTLSLWYKQDAVSNRFLFDIKDGTNRMALQLVNASTNYFYFNSAFNAYSAVDTPINQWNNVVFVFDGSQANVDRIKLYVNGSRITASITGTIDATLGTFGASTLANLAAASTGGSLYALNGEIANTQMWTTSLGATDVTTLYNNGVPLFSGTQPQAANLKGWWKLNVDTSTWSGTSWSIADSSGEGNTGTSDGMTTANLVNSDLTRSIPYSSYSLNFDGGDWATPSISLNTLSASTAFSVSCWVKIDTNTNYDHLVGAPTAFAAWDTGFGLYLNGTGIRFWVEQWNGVNQHVETAALNTGQWYHIMATFDTTNALKLYVDGATLTTASGTTIDGLTNTLYLGSTGANATYALNGNLNNVAIWNSELTQDQILTIYNGGVPNDISSLSPSAWWSLAGDSYYDGTNFILPDLSASSNNATTANMSGIELVGNAPGGSANGVATSMDIPANLKGDAPNSSSNAFSVNMGEVDRVESVPS